MKRKVAIVNVLYLDESHESDSGTFMEYYKSCITQAKQVQMGIVSLELNHVSLSGNELDHQAYDIDQVLLLNHSAYIFLRQCPLSLPNRVFSTHNTKDHPQSDLFGYIKELYRDNVVVLPNSDIIEYKIYCWSLTQYDMVLYMDLDMYVKDFNDILDIFTQCGTDSAVRLNPDQIVASTESTWCDMFNTGLFMIVPTQKKYLELLKFARETKSIDAKDQGLLNQYFNPYFHDSGTGKKPLMSNGIRESSSWVRLSYCYNVMITPRIHSNGTNYGHDSGQTFLYSIEQWSDRNALVNQKQFGFNDQNKNLFEQFAEKTKIVHFIVKPWSIGTTGPKPNSSQAYNPNTFYMQWHTLYEKNVPLEIKRYPVKAIKMNMFDKFVKTRAESAPKKAGKKDANKNITEHVEMGSKSPSDKKQTSVKETIRAPASRFSDTIHQHEAHPMENPANATPLQSNASVLASLPLTPPPKQTTTVEKTKEKDTLFPWCHYEDYPKPTRTFD
ncbi:hypothetical protein ACO0QE_001335 [Hanseniaspora vineae]